MDDRNFDALTRAFARGTSRRTAIKGIFGGLVGGMAVATTRLNHAGAQGGTPCDPLNVGTDCPLPDACTSATCEQAVGAEGYFCAYSGGCDEGACLECDTLSGTCVGTCGACQACDGGTCYDTCGDCEECIGGQCVYTCQGCESCINGLCAYDCEGVCCGGTCIEGGQCCVDEDCVGPLADFCSSVACIENLCTNIPECPTNQHCCGLGQEGAYCAFCCDNDDCEGPLGYCDDGRCITVECFHDSDCPDCMVCGEDYACAYLVCPLGETCCSGHECVPDADCCRGPGDYCGLLDVAGAGGDSSQQLDCCDGLLCCDHIDSMGPVCAQCCNDWDCGKDGTCNHGICEYPLLCIDDAGCPDHTCCCKDGTCSWNCCDHHHHHPHPHPKPKPPKPAPPATGGSVTTLPATGSGQESGSTGMFGAAALGAAAAFMAAKRLRETPDEVTQED